MRVTPHRFSRSAELSHKTRTEISADAKLRPLRDVIIVEPLEHNLSAVIHVINELKPVRGIVKAVGPGTYPKQYDHRDKKKRTKMWDSKAFRKTEVKVGDVVNLGGLDIGGYAFDSFYWGDKLHMICREEDVALIEGAGDGAYLTQSERTIRVGAHRARTGTD